MKDGVLEKAYCSYCDNAVAGAHGDCRALKTIRISVPSFKRRKMISEDQASIGKWADETFGRQFTAQRQCDRVLEECRELVAEPSAEEAADVAICLFVVAHRMGFDLQAAIDAKMDINRRRKWRVNGDGTGYHIK